MRRWVLVLLSLSLLASGCLTTAPAPADDPAPASVGDLLTATVGYYRSHRTTLTDWWEVVALAQAGEDLSGEQWTLPIFADASSADPATVYAGAILAQLALNNHAEHASSVRLLAAELAAQQVTLSGMAFGFQGGINQTVWAVIALEAAQVDYIRPAAARHLVEEQRDDGGFTLAGDTGDPDMTGMALVALGLLIDEDEVEAAVARALHYLQQAQSPSGGFSSYGQENANSLAAVIWGLMAVDEEMTAPAWHQEEGVVEALRRFQLPDGSFSYLQDPLTTCPLATAQVLLALADLNARQSSWLRLREAIREQMIADVPLALAEPAINTKPVSKDEPQPTPIQREKPGETVNTTPTITVQLQVIGKEDALFVGAVTVEKAGANALLALAETGLPFESRYGGAYVSQIGDEGEDPRTGAGWKFKVNGQAPSVSAIHFSLEEADEVVWWYAPNPGCTGPD